MMTEPHGLRARLLEAEPVSAAHRRRLEQEINNMFNNVLSRRGWWVWIASLIAACVLTAIGAGVLVGSRMDGFLRGIWWAYTLANAGFAVFAAVVVYSRRLEVQRLMAWSKLSPVLTLLITLLLFVRALGEPTPEAVLWLLFGVICLVVSLAVSVYNRVVAAEWRQREQALRIELRIEDLIERLGGDDGPGVTAAIR